MFSHALDERTALRLLEESDAEALHQGVSAAIVDDGSLAGCIGFARMDRANRSASLGYWLAGSSQGRGIVTRATAALVHHAFEVWRLHRVEIRAAPENVRSRRIPERLGFAQEGILREAERIGERYVDHVVYAMLDRDWSGAASQ